MLWLRSRNNHNSGIMIRRRYKWRFTTVTRLNSTSVRSGKHFGIKLRITKNCAPACSKTEISTRFLIKNDKMAMAQRINSDKYDFNEWISVKV